MYLHFGVWLQICVKVREREIIFLSVLVSGCINSKVLETTVVPKVVCRQSS